MRWIILSPHFDDAVLSCGGWIWEQVQQGRVVEAWTVCAGAAAVETLSPFAARLHERWGAGAEAVAPRRAEDEEALRLLGAAARYWNLPDCIYRRVPGGWLVNGEDDLWQPVHPAEEGLVERLAGWLRELLRPADHLVAPLSMGGHVDHRLVRAAAERAAQSARAPLYYYADYPYVVREEGGLERLIGQSRREHCREISSSGLRAWQEAVACYRSQLSTFWKSRAELDEAISAYRDAGGGGCLWSAPLLENAL